MNEPTPSPEVLRGFVHDTLGPVEIEDCSRSVGRQSTVWKLTGRDGALHYLKRHEARGLYDRATMAYTQWTPQLEGSSDWHVPRVVARDDDLGTLILEALPDATRVSEMPDDEDREAAYEAAGRLLAALHALPVIDAPEPRAHMAAQVERYVLKHAQVLEPDLRAWFHATFDDLAPLADAPIVCAHRDYSPRNWTARRTGDRMIVSAFDWERAEVDCAWHDFQRMEYDHWEQAPHLKRAFLTGYGRELSTHDQRQLDLVVLINAIASVAWARERGDTPFEALALRAIERLRSRGSGGVAGNTEDS